MRKQLRIFYNTFLSNEKDFTRKIKQTLHVSPANLFLYKLAFSAGDDGTSRYYAIRTNERLEYLGDAVLGSIVADYLFKKYPNKDEGFLTKMRSKVVKRKSLDKLARDLGLDLFIDSENRTLSKSALGDTMEAFIGAVFLDHGYAFTNDYVITQLLRRYVDVVALERLDDNYKSQLLEWCQKHGQRVDFEVLDRKKVNNRDFYKVIVSVDGKRMSKGEDFVKKAAEQQAAESALRSLGVPIFEQ